MNRIDINCFLGHWPFRRIRRNSMEELLHIHAENGITHGFVSSLNAVFYNDPFEGDEELHEMIKDTGYSHILTINPLLPGYREDVEKGAARFGIRGIRIYPGYHGYGPESPEFKELCNFLQTTRLPLMLTLRLEDERLNYICKPRSFTVQELQGFVENSAGIRLVLMNPYYHELMAIEEYIRSYPHVFFDLSGLKHYNFVLEKLIEDFPVEKMLYGSQFPLYSLKSSLLLVEKAAIGEAAKERILYRNAEAVLQLPH